MLDGFLRPYRDEKAREVRAKLHRVVACMSRFPPEVSTVATLTIATEILKFTAAHGTIDFISLRQRARLARQCYATARPFYDTNVPKHCGIVLFGLWLETAAIKSTIAAATHAEIEELIAAAVEKLRARCEPKEPVNFPPLPSRDSVFWKN